MMGRLKNGSRGKKLMGELVELFDRDLLVHRRNRVATGAGDHAFLLDRIAMDFCERMSGIKRTFDVGLNLGAYHGVLSRELRSLENVGMLIDVDPAFEMVRLCDGPRVLADEAFLPFSNGALDVVVSGLSL